MNRHKNVALVLLLSSALLAASCASITQEQLTANEQSRVEQERKGYFDRESSARQRKDEEHAAQEKLRSKS